MSAAAVAPILNPEHAKSSSSEKHARDETWMRGQIASLAYSIWEQQGCPEGSAEANWLEAERQLLIDIAK